MMGGVPLLLQTLKELEEKGNKGQILTTNYLNFSEPKALEKLNGLKNITLKRYDVEDAGSYEYDKDYVFATVETLNRDMYLFRYQPEAFDCIILDEYEIIGLSQEAA